MGESFVRSRQKNSAATTSLASRANVGTIQRKPKKTANEQENGKRETVRKQEPTTESDLPAKGTKPTVHRRRVTDGLVPVRHPFLTKIPFVDSAATSDRRKPAKRPPIRYQAKLYIGPLVYAQSGTGKRLLALRWSWNRWPR